MRTVGETRVGEEFLPAATSPYTELLVARVGARGPVSAFEFLSRAEGFDIGDAIDSEDTTNPTFRFRYLYLPHGLRSVSVFEQQRLNNLL